jgi:adenylate kinase family enzyme
MNLEELSILIREQKEEMGMLKEVSILKNKHPMKALYIFGPAGAGKSFLSKNIGVPSDFVNLNTDERVEEDFRKLGISLKFDSHDPEEGETESALEMIQQQARMISQNAASRHGFNLLNSATPVIFDTTGENINKMSGRIRAISDLGYDVAVLLVNVPTHVSVAADQGRDRTVGLERTTCISKEFQENVHKYFANLSSRDNVTILGNEMYHNLYDLREKSYGSLSTGVSQEDIDCVRTPNGDVYDIAYATNLLNKIRSEFGDWVKNRMPINQRGKDVVDSMRYLVTNSGGMLGRYLTDIPLSYQGGVDNKIVAAGAEVVGDAQKTVKSSLTKEKPVSGASMRSLAKMGGGYRDSPDERRVRAYQEKNPASLEERILSRLMEISNK